MDATTMLSTQSLLDTLQHDFPQFQFKAADSFRWSPDTQTLYVDTLSPDFSFFALHELGHALLGHTSYTHDIDLIKIERDAWYYAVRHLADTYNVAISETSIQDNLDTYRDWLHARSQCPSCHASGLQASINTYTCLACGCRWKTNEARNCALRRHTLPTI